MTTAAPRISIVLAALWMVAAARGQPVPAPSRGELLYTTHCVACHDTQVHWRDGKLARDWDSLKVQVRRWQQIGRLGWDEDDIDEVARFLNDAIYRHPRPLSPVARH